MVRHMAWDGGVLYRYVGLACYYTDVASTHQGLVTYMCVIKLDHNWFRRQAII